MKGKRASAKRVDIPAWFKNDIHVSTAEKKSNFDRKSMKRKFFQEKARNRFLGVAAAVAEVLLRGRKGFIHPLFEQSLRKMNGTRSFSQDS